MKFNIDQVIEDIKSIKIQGATNIAKASIGALFELSGKYKDKDIDIFLKEIGQKAEMLAWARPDEPLNQNLINFLLAKIKEDKSKDVADKIISFKALCQEARELILKNEEAITVNGINLIKKMQKKKNLLKNVILSEGEGSRGSTNKQGILHPPNGEFRMTDEKYTVNIFTHCNSSSVARILIGAHRTKIPLKVYDSETRPRFQGRILAKHLAKTGIDVTMMTDSAAPFVISQNDPDKIDIDLVIIGADVVGMDGSALNKIGSYSLALAAKNSSVPFYAATSLLKVRKDIDSYKNIEIEKRDPAELWAKSLKGLKMINYAFDTVPPEYIKGLITEFGIVKPEEVKKTAMKNYKEIFK